MQEPSHSSGPSTHSSAVSSKSNHHSMNGDKDKEKDRERDRDRERDSKGSIYRPPHITQSVNKQQSSPSLSAAITTSSSSSQPTSHQQQQQQSSRSINRHSQNGQGGQTSYSERGLNTSSSGMGDGIINQSMRDDMECWIESIGLSYDTPLNVVGFFGHCSDLSVFERVLPAFDSDQNDSIYGSLNSGYQDESGGSFIMDHEGIQDDEQRYHWPMCISKTQTTGDINVYVDRSKNTLMLQHAFLHDTRDILSVCLESNEVVSKDRSSLLKWLHDQEFESHRALLFLFLVSQVVVYTSEDLNIDPKIISILSALSSVKRQIMQELDRFMTICWDRIGIQAPDHHLRQNSDQSGASGGDRERERERSGRAQNSISSIFTPGKCVPVLVFVIEKVPVMAPWYDAGASENQIVEQLRQSVLKRSIDALQTRLRYIFRASKLVQSIDSPSGVFDSRQLFVLPSPSNTPFIHVIPQFTGHLELPQRFNVNNSIGQSYDSGGGILDPAEEVLRQKMKFGTNGGYNNGSSKKYGGGGGRGNAKSAYFRNQREKKLVAQSISTSEDTPLSTSLSDIPTLRGIYDSIIQARDQPLERAAGWNSSRGEDMVKKEPISLGSLYQDYSGPMLKNFIDGWIKNISSPGGYGNVVGKRNAGSVEIPSLQQWIAGSLGVCEGLGINSLIPPESNTNLNNKQNEPNSYSFVDGDNAASSTQEERENQTSTEDHAINSKLSRMTIGGNGRRSGNGKKYSHKCANLVQKKIQDYIQTDDVMEELYGQKPDTLNTNTNTRAHSERYLKLKADQATKLFQTLAHRR